MTLEFADPDFPFSNIRVVQYINARTGQVLFEDPVPPDEIFKINDGIRNGTIKEVLIDEEEAFFD